MNFADPGWLWLLLTVIPITVAVFARERMRTSIRYPGLYFLRGRDRFVTFKYICDILRVLAVSLFIIGLCRPQEVMRQMLSETRGVDIFMALDRSSSMSSEDFRPDNRIEVAKKVMAEFIDRRQTDRLGLVVFARYAYLQAPLTLDHSILKRILRQVDWVGDASEDGTAIGMGLLQAVNRLKESKARSRIVILMTDGVNNQGAVDPLTAAEVARSYGIKVYTIGVGTDGTAPRPVVHPFFGRIYKNMPVQIDEETLREIARLTGGKYYRARGSNELQQIYREIDSLEKSRFEQKITRYKEKYLVFVLTGLLLLFLEVTLRQTFFQEVF